MEELARFLRTAHWQQTGHNTYFCDDPRLETLWVDLVKELPASLKGYGLQAWKLNGTTKILEPEGYIQPLPSIPGETTSTDTNEPRILGGPKLTPESGPIAFTSEVILTGSLYFIVALPPRKSK
ncbi:unnamed protein product [Aspergillus oryzae]|uniref:Unnamed protein product n=1 Tax=Aspergillus oryzae TaxID=5062 RepID=A0AAN4YU81_ASPOZ|nr:unnamed protein product [Aspergillus oryzae]GMG38228.1 unnamed protein product [Aspergillus oryzae]